MAPPLRLIVLSLDCTGLTKKIHEAIENVGTQDNDEVGTQVTILSTEGFLNICATYFYRVPRELGSKNTLSKMRQKKKRILYRIE